MCFLYTIPGKGVLSLKGGALSTFSPPHRRERSWRVAVFFGGSALAGAFGGMASSYLLSYTSNKPSLGIFAYVIGLMNW